MTSEAWATIVGVCLATLIPTLGAAGGLYGKLCALQTQIAGLLSWMEKISHGESPNCVRHDAMIASIEQRQGRVEQEQLAMRARVHELAGRIPGHE